MIDRRFLNWPVGLGPLFFQFLKDCFFRNSDRNETARLVFFQHPLVIVRRYITFVISFTGVSFRFVLYSNSKDVPYLWGCGSSLCSQLQEVKLLHLKVLHGSTVLKKKAFARRLVFAEGAIVA